MEHCLHCDETHGLIYCECCKALICRECMKPKEEREQQQEEFFLAAEEKRPVVSPSPKLRRVK